MPVLFGSECGRVPTEIVDAHRTMGNRLVCPEPDLSFVGLRRKCRLPRLPRLLFHDHERFALQAASKIVTESNRRSDSLPWNRGRLRLLLQIHLEKTGIVIEGNKVEIGVEHSLVNCVERQADIVGGHEMLRA